MFRSIRLGKAFGIPLFIHWSYWLAPLFLLAVTLSEGLASVLFAQLLTFSLFGCVLLHELGHALMARFLGIRTRDITLYPIGGVARLESTGSQPLEEICIALAGPAVNLGIVLLLAPIAVLTMLAGLLQNPALLGSAGVVTFLATYLTLLWLGNGVLLVFNLLPVFPMDGGRVLRALLSLSLGHLRATEVAATLALVLSGALVLMGFLGGIPSLMIVPFVIAFAGQAELHALRRQARRREPEVEPAPGRTDWRSIPQMQGFTGFVWDRDNGVWIRWVNGRPLSF